MSTQIILKVLAQRHQLRQRDRWTRSQLEEYQGRALRLLREHAYERSPFYRHFHKGFTDCSLNDLPVFTKQMVMEHFNELVTRGTSPLVDDSLQACGRLRTASDAQDRPVVKRQSTFVKALSVRQP